MFRDTASFRRMRRIIIVLSQCIFEGVENGRPLSSIQLINFAFSVPLQINEISVIQNVNSNVSNRILSGFGNFGGTFPGDMMKTEPGTTSDKQNDMSPPSHHMRTPPLWDMHFDRQSAVNLKSADDHQLNNCAPQSPQSSPIAHTNHISQNRTEGLAT